MRPALWVHRNSTTGLPSSRRPSTLARAVRRCRAKRSASRGRKLRDAAGGGELVVARVPFSGGEHTTAAGDRLERPQSLPGPRRRRDHFSDRGVLDRQAGGSKDRTLPPPRPGWRRSGRAKPRRSCDADQTSRRQRVLRRHRTVHCRRPATTVVRGGLAADEPGRVARRCAGKPGRRRQCLRRRWRGGCPMRAGDLAAPFPTVGLDTPAIEAARLLAGQNLPGLIVVDDGGPAVRRPARHAGAADGGAVVLPGRPDAGPGDRRGRRRRVPPRARRPHGARVPAARAAGAAGGRRRTPRCWRSRR